MLEARLPVEAGALLLKALDAAMPEAPRDPKDSQDTLHVSAETSPGLRPRPMSLSARRADALGVLAESFLAHGAAALNGGERHQIVVRVDEATLEQRHSGRCEVEEGPAIPVETARRLGCDASRIEILEDEAGELLDVGRKTRTIPPALRKALNARDKGCVFPGCTHTRYVDGHHIQHWADGAETKLSSAPGETAHQPRSRWLAVPRSATLSSTDLLAGRTPLNSAPPAEPLRTRPVKPSDQPYADRTRRSAPASGGSRRSGARPAR